MALLDKYNPGDFFDEMFASEGQVRPHYAALFERFQNLDREEFEQRRDAVDAAFLRQGITFTVYSDEQGTERIFPFDLVPRIIPAAEWSKIETGLIQRMLALNLFLKDIYSEQRILKEKIVPMEDVVSAKHFRPEMVGFSVPRDIFTFMFVAAIWCVTAKVLILCWRITGAAPQVFPICWKIGSR